MATVRFLDGQEVVTVCGPSVHEVVKSKQFLRWLEAFDHKHMQLKTVVVQSVDFFDDGKVIFAKFEADVVDRKTGKSIPGIVFLRGDAVTVLTLVVCDEEPDKLYVALTEQARVAVGEYKFLASPAGITSDSDDSYEVRALTELYEETGIPSDQVPALHALGKMTPSEGGCDEQIDCFAVLARLSRAQLDTLLSTTHGVDSEHITLRLMALDELVVAIARGEVTDAKTMCALLLLLAQREKGRLVDLIQTAATAL